MGFLTDAAKGKQPDPESQAADLYEKIKSKIKSDFVTKRDLLEIIYYLLPHLNMSSSDRTVAVIERILKKS